MFIIPLQFHSQIFRRLVVFDCGIKIHEFRPRGLHPLQHHLPDAHGQVVTETLIRFGIMTQDTPGENRAFRGGMGASAEMPALRREEPRPAERFASANSLNRDQAFATHEHLQTDASVIDQVKILCIGIRLFRDVPTGVGAAGALSVQVEEETGKNRGLRRLRIACLLHCWIPMR